MKTVRAEYLDFYYKSGKDGNPYKVFVYTVDGDAEDLAIFEDIQGKHFSRHQDTDAILWHHTRNVGNHIDLRLNEKSNKVTPDTSDVARLDSAVEQMGTGMLAQEFAREAAKELMKNYRTRKASAPSTPRATQPTPEPLPSKDDSSEEMDSSKLDI